MTRQITLQKYVKDMASTNSIESVWAVLKRSIAGTCRHVSVKHLSGYVNEATFRLNEGGVRNMLMARTISLCAKTAGTMLPCKEPIRQNA